MSKQLSPMKKTMKKCFIAVAPKTYVRQKYYRAFGKKLNETDPQTLSEKIHCFMMYNRNPIYIQCADKLEVRKYIENKLGGGYAANILPKHYAVVDKPEDFPINDLPDKFVLKSNHSSGQVIVCTDKNKFDWNNAIHVMRGWLKDNYYYNRAEWQYKDIQPRLFAEELLAVDIMDYRIFCCSGQVVFIRATVHDPESKTGWAVGVYDKEWNPCECHQPNDTAIVVDKPQCLDEMVYIAEKLSEDFGFVRVDLYNVNQKPYFAELTFTPNSGIYFFEPKEWDLKLGQMSNIKIRE